MFRYLLMVFAVVSCASAMDASPTAVVPVPVRLTLATLASESATLAQQRLNIAGEFTKFRSDHSEYFAPDTAAVCTPTASTPLMAAARPTVGDRFIAIEQPFNNCGAQARRLDFLAKAVSAATMERLQFAELFEQRALDFLTASLIYQQQLPISFNDHPKGVDLTPQVLVIMQQQRVDYTVLDVIARLNVIENVMKSLISTVEDGAVVLYCYLNQQYTDPACKHALLDEMLLAESSLIVDTLKTVYNKAQTDFRMLNGTRPVRLVPTQPEAKKSGCCC